MRVLFGLDAVGSELAGGVLAIGNFDGVHLGHQRILRRAVEKAAEARGPVGVMTFDPHPLAVLRPGLTPPRLTPLNEKLLQLSRAGAETVIVVAVDRAFLALSADEFVERVVVDRVRPAGLVEGPSFHYGHGRGGNIDTLRTAGARHGFEVEIVDPLEIEVAPGEKAVVSSSWVREVLAAGNVERGAVALGRPYVIEGRVVEGRGRGRELGFATANVAAGEFLVPAEGVYGAVAEVGGRRSVAALSIGRTPTFAGTATLVEAHLLDFDGNVYGQLMRLELMTWVRPQRKFASATDLIAQIEKDVAAIRTVAAERQWRL